MSDRQWLLMAPINLHIISGRFQNAVVECFGVDNSGHLLSTRGPFNSPVSITHDTQGNIYVGQGTILKIDTAGNGLQFHRGGGAQWIDMAPNQRTIYYSASNGDVKTFDIVSRTPGPDIARRCLGRNVRVLPEAAS